MHLLRSIETKDEQLISAVTEPVPLEKEMFDFQSKNVAIRKSHKVYEVAQGNNVTTVADVTLSLK